jgi:hypothetical protein
MLLDALIELNKLRPSGDAFLDVLRTARKWISGLNGDDNLAFYDLDPTRLGQDGAVLQSIATHTLRAIWHGAIVGTDDRLEELARGLLAGQGVCLRGLEIVARGWLTRRLQRAEDVYRRDVMDIAGGDAARPLRPPALEALRADWAGESPLSADPRGTILPKAHDFVIPSASHAFVEASPLFLGNLVNPDASHLSGARLETHPFTDLDLTCRLLRRMVTR